MKLGLAAFGRNVGAHYKCIINSDTFTDEGVKARVKGNERIFEVLLEEALTEHELSDETKISIETAQLERKTRLQRTRSRSRSRSRKRQ